MHSCMNQWMRMTVVVYQCVYKCVSLYMEMRECLWYLLTFYGHSKEV
jgi:hypothetical protein